MKVSKTMGRPRAFDPDAALETAMHLFWRKGYEGTSLSDLTDAIGVNRPSLYAAFGNKEELFRRACARYGEMAPHLEAACALPTAREAVTAFLYGAADNMVDPEHSGCMLVTSCLAGSEETEGVRQVLSEARQASVEVWRARFERARAESDLPATANPLALAQYVMTISHGLTVHARSGASPKELRQVVDVALLAFPGSV